MASRDWEIALFAGVGFGAGLMYFLDPGSGRRRRRLVGDQILSVAGRADDALATTARDAGHRLRGAVHEAARHLHEGRVEDGVLIERVRAKLGRYVSHPGAIDVLVDDGLVTLRGPVLASEVDRLLRTVENLPGVYDVISELEVHDTRDGVPSLQGGETAPGDRGELRRESWSPAVRCLGGTVAGGLALYGAARRDGLGLLTAAAGVGVLLRALTNMPARRLTGIGAGRRAVELRDAIHIALPIERVFAAWTDYANFPRFMSHVREVRAGDDQRSHWVVDGPAGRSVHWEAVLTRFEPPSVLAWKTLPGSPIPNAGLVRFAERPGGGTDVGIRLSYNPPGGALGHALAVLLGADPRRRMRDDLLRMKTFLETGRPPHDAAQPAGEPAPEAVAVTPG